MRAGALRLRRRGCTAGAGGPVSPAPSLRPWKLGLPPQARARARRPRPRPPRRASARDATTRSAKGRLFATSAAFGTCATPRRVRQTARFRQARAGALGPSAKTAAPGGRSRACLEGLPPPPPYCCPYPCPYCTRVGGLGGGRTSLLSTRAAVRARSQPQALEFRAITLSRTSAGGHATNLCAQRARRKELPPHSLRARARTPSARQRSRDWRERSRRAGRNGSKGGGGGALRDPPRREGGRAHHVRSKRSASSRQGAASHSKR